MVRVSRATTGAAGYGVSLTCAVRGWGAVNEADLKGFRNVEAS